MDIIGKWKIQSIETVDFSSDKMGKKVINRDNLAQEDREMQQIFNLITAIEEDHTVHELFELPKDLKLSDLRPHEREKVKDGFLETSQPKRWKEEGGKFYLDTNVKGEILGEEVSPYSAQKYNFFRLVQGFDKKAIECYWHSVQDVTVEKVKDILDQSTLNPLYR